MERGNVGTAGPIPGRGLMDGGFVETVFPCVLFDHDVGTEGTRDPRIDRDWVSEKVDC